MDGSVTSQAAAEVESLEWMAGRIQGGASVERPELDRVLEVGVGCLIGLKAQLRQLGDRSLANGNRADPTRVELEEWISKVGTALSELRSVASPGGSRMGYGFVLPGPSRRSKTV
jgi:hypothetical protein